MRRAALRLGLSSTLALGAPYAVAQPAGSPGRQASLSESLSGEAKEAFTQAQGLYDHKDFAGAFIKYEQAYNLAKDPRLLFDMALCERNLHAYAQMRTLLVRYGKEAGATLSAHDKAELSSMLLAVGQLVGTVRVDAGEPGATVVVNGQPVATTPLADPLVLDLGDHTVQIQKPGFEPVRRTIHVVGGGETSITATLTPVSHVAQLVVTSDDTALVVIDGTQTGRGRFDGSLAAGIHAVSVTEPGKVAYRGQVTLRDGESRSIQVTLQDEKRGASWWPWAAGGGAAAAGLATAGYFLFRPQDQSTGAPPSATWGSVQLASWRRR